MDQNTLLEQPALVVLLAEWRAALARKQLLRLAETNREVMAG